MNKTRKQQELDFKKSLIINAAKTIFFKNGFENSTIEDIAKEANYSKGSIYTYFKSKNEICFSIVNNYYQRIADMSAQISRENLSGLEKLLSFKNRFLIEFTQQDEFCQIFDSFKYHRGTCMKEATEISKNIEYNRQISLYLESFIDSGVSDNSIKAEVRPKILANALWGLEHSFVSELRYSEVNGYNYLFNLIIESIKNIEEKE